MNGRVLWIEDGALVEFPEYLADLHAQFDYDVDLARNASEGLEKLLAAEEDPYSAVVVDLRLPPGDDPIWAEIYLEHHANLAAARLGLVLLAVAFGRSSQFLQGKGLASSLLAKIAKLPTPRWPAKHEDHFGILTVEEEAEISPLLEKIGLGALVVQTKQVEKGPGLLSSLVSQLVGSS